MIRIDPNVVSEFGGEAQMHRRVLDFAAAREAHRFTVDQPAPIEHPLIEAIVARGGWSAVQIVRPPPPSDEPREPIPWGTGLEAVKAAAMAKVDRVAEARRQQHITPGPGQALEYQATEAEARRWKPGDGFAGYPFMRAEADAIEDATGTRPSAAEVASAIIMQADAWAQIGARIKRRRRAAKMKIEAATTEDEVRVLVEVVWDDPPPPAVVVANETVNDGIVAGDEIDGTLTEPEPGP
jgi:hypothetical protein